MIDVGTAPRASEGLTRSRGERGGKAMRICALRASVVKGFASFLLWCVDLWLRESCHSEFTSTQIRGADHSNHHALCQRQPNRTGRAGSQTYSLRSHAARWWSRLDDEEVPSQAL